MLSARLPRGELNASNSYMNQARVFPCHRHRSLLLRGIVLLSLAAMDGAWLPAQDAPQGPLAPPPEHHVTRVGNVAEPEAPPSLPETEIIKHFSEKEDEYILSRTRYTYRKTIRIQEFGPDGQPSGEFVLVTQPGRDADGKLFEKVVERPRSTLPHLFLRSEEIECYIFQAKPKMVERVRAYFDGIVWVDVKYLEVVKTYGKWVTDQGDMHPVADLPFSLFETYRENVDGKYWFPNYSRSDGTLNLKGQEIPVRLVIKWTDFKPVQGAPQAAVPPAPATTAKP